MDLFKAIVIKQQEDEVTYGVEQISENQLSQGDVLVKVAYSSINYKDMLAVQKKAESFAITR